MRADLEISSQEHYQIKNNQRSAIGKHYLEMHWKESIEKPHREKEHKNGTGKRE